MFFCNISIQKAKGVVFNEVTRSFVSDDSCYVAVKVTLLIDKTAVLLVC